MKDNRKRLLTILAVCALSLSAIAAAPSSAEAPQALQNEQAVSGVLTGNGGGAFAYYNIHYPGDESAITIEMRYNPADPVTSAGVGFNVYGADGYYIGQGQAVADTGGDGIFRLEYAGDNAATWLVQVYNYLPDITVGYNIVAEGLPETATPAAEAAEVVTAAETTVATEPAPLSESGYLTGNAGGAYATHTVTVPAEATDIQVTLIWQPDDPVIATGVGFAAYGPAGQVHTSVGTGNPGERTVTLPTDEPGIYQIQVYNYIDGLTIRYALRSEALE